MLEKYGIRRGRQVRLYAPEEYSPEYDSHNVANAIYAALYHFNSQEYAFARRAADIASNTQQGSLAKFISGISSFELGDTKSAIKQLTEFCLMLTDRTFVKNPTALWNIAEEILVRLVGNQIGYLLGEESREKEYFADIMSELVEFADTDSLDFRFTSQLSYQTQLKLIEYLYSNKKIDKQTYKRERNYILACMTQNKGLDLKATAEFIKEGFKENTKAREAVKDIADFENMDFTSDRYLYYKTLETMHAHKIITTEDYIDKLIKLKREFAKEQRDQQNEADLEGLRAQFPKQETETNDTDGELSELSSGVSIDAERDPPLKSKQLSLDLSGVVPAGKNEADLQAVEKPIAFVPENLVDTINRQLLQHGVARLLIKEKEEELERTKAPALYFSILQHKHANGLISTEDYVRALHSLNGKFRPDDMPLRFSNGPNDDNNALDTLNLELDPPAKAKLLDEINDQIFIHDRDRNEDYVTTPAVKERVLAQNIMRNYYADVWQTTVALPKGLRHFVWALSTLWLPFHALGAKLTSAETKLQQLAKASVETTRKEELEDKKRIVATFSEGTKTVAVKERVLGQHIFVNYYKDVWNTLALSKTRPTALKVLFFIPRALIAVLSTVYLPVHAAKAKMTSVETKLQKSSQASIDSKHRAESNPKNKWHAFFREKLPVPQRDVVRAAVRPVPVR